MVTAIVGGAIIPPLMGLLADATGSVQLGFLVPLAALLYIAWAGLANLRRWPRPDRRRPWPAPTLTTRAP